MNYLGVINQVDFIKNNFQSKAKQENLHAVKAIKISVKNCIWESSLDQSIINKKLNKLKLAFKDDCCDSGIIKKCEKIKTLISLFNLPDGEASLSAAIGRRTTSIINGVINSVYGVISQYYEGISINHQNPYLQDVKKESLQNVEEENAQGAMSVEDIMNDILVSLTNSNPETAVLFLKFLGSKASFGQGDVIDELILKISQRKSCDVGQYETHEICNMLSTIFFVGVQSKTDKKQLCKSILNNYLQKLKGQQETPDLKVLKSVIVEVFDEKMVYKLSLVRCLKLVKKNLANIPNSLNIEENVQLKKLISRIRETQDKYLVSTEDKLFILSISNRQFKIASDDDDGDDFYPGNSDLKVAFINDPDNMKEN